MNDNTMQDVTEIELETVEGGDAFDVGRTIGQIVGCTAYFLGGWIFNPSGSVLCHD